MTLKRKEDDDKPKRRRKRVNPDIPISNAPDIPKESIYTLILQNSDKVSFEHVLYGLTSVMNYNILQGIQIATIAHHKGSCEIKSVVNDKTILQKYKYQLEELGLPVALEVSKN